MLRLGRASSFVFNKLETPASLRPFLSSFQSTICSTRSLPRRALSSTTEPQNDLYNYTSGRWLYNESLRQKERRTHFDVDGLCRLAAESVNQSPTDVVSMSKLAEGGFNRTLVVALRDGRQVVARVPYPLTAPNYHAVASEVATIEYQRSLGIPVPKIYGYSADSNNAAGTPYILMEFVHGSTLGDVWSSLRDEEVVSVVRQLTQLEARMMAQPFPAGGSLYFTKDLEKVTPGLGVPLDDKRFCIGPDTEWALWYGRRAGLDVNRGPYHSAEAALAAAAQKELVYLKHFGQPLLPMRRERRSCYKYQPQSPSAHVENLERYLRIAPALVPRDPAQSRFTIRHQDLHPNNILVSRAPDGSDCKIVSLLDWQHTQILPMFLLAGISRHLCVQKGAQAMAPPARPEGLDEMDPDQRESEEDDYRGQLAHYQYVKSTREINPLHYAAFSDPLHDLRDRLFLYAGAPWQGETSDLKEALIEAKDAWEELAGAGVPCPLEFDKKDLEETALLGKELLGETRAFELLQLFRLVGEQGWVSVENYEEVVDFFKECKEDGLAEAESEKEREEIRAHWPWDDMDERMYM
ncbi:kinase-like domain-containing protein [Ephemerocybe angulata]|uniref:Kinase-like domain-containing protein n=1 Tax=Ephemerocybe angulata TaxID=980116 RepID=A0A8H6I611_9AGAR|nr:kinase-like domain-containing protein [Tulosesus angulatus]